MIRAKQNTPYPLDKRKLPKMRRSFVLIMDILGFSNLIMSSENRQQLLERFWKDTNHIINELKPSSVAPEVFSFKAYVDNVLLAYPIDSVPPWDSEPYYGFITLDAAWYQLNFAARGWFVRGAITVGDVFVGENMVFGAPIIEAHRLESKTAKYPRIILSNDVVDMARDHLQFYKSGCAPHIQSLLVDEKGVTFLNYLNLAYDGSVEPEEAHEILKRHKERIENNLALNNTGVAKDEGVLKKYRWLARYHNSVINIQGNIQKEHRIPNCKKLPLRQFGNE
jgi:hypothetical protein